MKRLLAFLLLFPAVALGQTYESQDDELPSESPTESFPPYHDAGLAAYYKNPTGTGDITAWTNSAPVVGTAADFIKSPGQNRACSSSSSFDFSGDSDFYIAA